MVFAGKDVKQPVRWFSKQELDRHPHKSLDHRKINYQSRYPLGRRATVPPEAKLKAPMPPRPAPTNIKMIKKGVRWPNPETYPCLTFNLE
jgi:hypothetical protein